MDVDIIISTKLDQSEVASLLDFYLFIKPKKADFIIQDDFENDNNLSFKSILISEDFYKVIFKKDGEIKGYSIITSNLDIAQRLCWFNKSILLNKFGHEKQINVIVDIQILNQSFWKED